MPPRLPHEELREMSDELQATCRDLAAVLDETQAAMGRMDAALERLERGQIEGENRILRALGELHDTVRGMKAELL